MAEGRRDLELYLELKTQHCIHDMANSTRIFFHSPNTVGIPVVATRQINSCRESTHQKPVSQYRAHTEQHLKLARLRSFRIDAVEWFVPSLAKDYSRNQRSIGG